jgi:hypothetical protein
MLESALRTRHTAFRSIASWRRARFGGERQRILRGDAEVRPGEGRVGEVRPGELCRTEVRFR